MDIAGVYSAAFLESRTAYADAGLAVPAYGAPRVQIRALMKSVVRTPMKGGSVDYDAVPAGSSIWVTVKDEHSPMHGRPVLITKRPDGQFALEGGSGVSHWHDDPEREKKIAARRHMVMATKSPDKAKADEGQVKDQAKVAQKNEERATAKAARDDAAGQTREAVGIDADQRIGRRDRNKIADTGAQKLQEHGLSPEEAQGAAKHLPSAVQEAKNRVVAHHVAARVDSAHGVSGGRLARTDDHQPAQEQRSVGFRDRPEGLPSHGSAQVKVSHGAVAEAVKRAKRAKGGGDLSQPEMEQAVKESVHVQVDQKLATPGSDDQGAGDLPVADIPEWKPGTPEEANGAVQAFQREAQARGMKPGDVTPDEVANGEQQAVPAKAIDRDLTDAEGLSDSAYDTLMDQYRQASKAPEAGAFYRALGEHWSSPHDYAASLAGHVARGASEGWQEVARYGLSGGGIDVPDLVNRLGVDAAAHVLAAHALAQKGGDAKGVDTLVRAITASGGQRIKAVEQAALSRHADLQGEAGALARALDKEPGAGAGDAARRADLQAAHASNINQQRATLGGALGHMQMRATFLHALARFGKAMKAGTGSEGVPVALSFGDDERAADEAALALRAPQGAIHKLHDIRHGWTLQVDATRLQAAARQADQRGKELATARETQRDDQPAEDYAVPGQAPQIPDGHGGHASIRWTPMQRDDIDFLHKSSGGVLAGSRGGGKRLAALGWAAKQAAADPGFRGVVSTDEGGATAFRTLAASRFPGLKLHGLPPHADEKDVTKAIRDFGTSGGGLLVLPHGSLAARHRNQIARLADEGAIHGHILDNPPQDGDGRGRAMTDAGHDLAQMTAGTDVRRVALTDHHPVEQPGLAAQLAHWAHPDKVSATDMGRAREAASGLHDPTEANDSAIQRQIVDGLASSVAAAPFARSGANETPQQALQRVRAEDRRAQHPPQGRTQEQADWQGELERAIRDGNDGEAHAVLDMAHHYGWEPAEARALYQKLTGEDAASNPQADSVEREQIENSPYFSVFQHFNADSKLKKVNPSTGQRLLGRDARTGKLGQSTAEPWEMAGSGYDEVAADALARHEGGHSQRYGMDAGDFWRGATAAHRRYHELLGRAAPGGPQAASQAAVAVGGGAKERKKIAGIFARKPDKAADTAPTGPANTPVGMLPGTPKLAVGGANYTPITMTPEDAAGGNVVPVQAQRPAPLPTAPEQPFKLQMQYGGLTDAEASRVKQEDAGQQSLGMGLPPTPRAKKGKLRKSLVLLGRRR